MGKAWDDTGIAYNVNLWKEVLRVLKPGGHLLSFGGSRTYHRMACAIEDAGFEIRDMVDWVYGSGFPKSLNIGKAVDKLQGNQRIKGELKFKGGTQLGVINDDSWKPKDVYSDKGNSDWEGYGTALKPAHEPIVLARKPLSEKTVALNVLKWGVGGLAIDNCRIKYIGKIDSRTFGGRWKTDKAAQNVYEGGYAGENQEVSPIGRFPANFIHDDSQEVLDLFPETKIGKMKQHIDGGKFNVWGKQYPRDVETIGDGGSAARFFYCAKASKKERDIGCNSLEEKESIYPGANSFDEEGNRLISNGTIILPLKAKNFHPTVKPLSLMKYLITLISREGQVVLDPFMGSGSTGIACKFLNRKFIGIEKESEYFKIAETRIRNAKING